MQLDGTPLTIIYADRYFDSQSASFVDDSLAISVSEETGLIHNIQPLSEVANNPPNVPKKVIDLRGLTLLPGFVDTHVHFFLHPYTETSWEDQLTKESLVERTVRAVNHAKETLLAGYTSVRDLGTEGAGDADVNLRQCISRPLQLIPGPRYFISNRALVVSGSYGPKLSLHPLGEGVEGITGAQVVDGVEECRKAVRQQIGAGADWSSHDPDYSFRSRMSGVSTIGTKALRLFSKEELSVIISTAHSLGVKVAAHASIAEIIKELIALGVDSIEHGYLMDDEALRALQGSKTVWNPTLAAYYSHPSNTSGERWKQCRETFQKALNMGGINFACGGDTGVFAHGQNALELKLMADLGMDPKKVLQSATLGGWESKGFAADIVASSGDLENDFSHAVSPSAITFVMKGGRVFKQNEFRQG
ncbi:hypothetical protein SISSUDRAFT_1012401 [Sistotremastrum suecicum HHB10207 ss-3]|uniref:Amidohydrolase-related domain-containing protein n=1 Tax=Sistotremastrum suecicum HHB10207 ss-3 TaxID=1314776 RepID=A0A166J2L8_9AGAM|nr:hypothetical protein SISSUDRAFT_1012401 [Sistotremastrum suecicum HHB10207 ss-3]